MRAMASRSTARIFLCPWTSIRSGKPTFRCRRYVSTTSSSRYRRCRARPASCCSMRAATTHSPRSTAAQATGWQSSMRRPALPARSCRFRRHLVPKPRTAAAPTQVEAKRTVDQWRRELQGKRVEIANEMIVADGTDEAYEAFVGLFAQPPFGPQAREWLDRHRRMVAWNNAVIVNSATAYRAFLLQYPDSDLTATARKLEDRLRNRPNTLASVAAVVGGAPNSSPAPAPASPG